MFIEGSKCVRHSIFTKYAPDCLKLNLKYCAQVWASPAQDRYEHTGASPQKGLEGAGAYVTYLIRSNKGGNKEHN